MIKEDLKDISDDELLYLFEAFIQMWHYEATDEFVGLREHSFDLNDVRNEVSKRLSRR